MAKNQRNLSKVEIEKRQAQRAEELEAAHASLESFGAPAAQLAAAEEGIIALQHSEDPIPAEHKPRIELVARLSSNEAAKQAAQVLLRRIRAGR